MKAHPLAKNYDLLTPEERFRLIMAASQRGDEAEWDRLVQAGSRLTLTLVDHAPYAYAFGEMELMTFLDLLEEAACYLQALQRSDKVKEEADEGDTPKSVDHQVGELLAWNKSIVWAFAAGYRLRTKAEGWNQFCRQMQIYPYLQWQTFPGYSRLKGALAAAEEFSFTPEAYLRWVNSNRRAAEPELSELPLTEAAEAAEIMEAYRCRVRWWGG